MKNANIWTICNLAAIGRSYGSFKTLAEALAAAKARCCYKLHVIDEDRRIVYFREELSGF